MDTALAVGICLTCFVGGIVFFAVFSKAVLSEAQSIKEHFTSEITKLRGEFSALLSEAAKKV